jgi:hypothetical protein
MGLDFRKTLIIELERRQREIDSMLALLRRIQNGGGALPRDPGPSWPESNKRSKPISNSGRGAELYSEIVELRQQGLSLRAIAEQVHLSHAGVWKVLRRPKDGAYKR